MAVVIMMVVVMLGLGKEDEVRRKCSVVEMTAVKMIFPSSDTPLGSLRRL